MRRVIAALAGCLILGGCAPAPAPAAPVPVVRMEEDPAETGMCHGRYIRVEVPAVPAEIVNPELYLQSYYDSYMRTYCAAEAAARVLWV